MSTPDTSAAPSQHRRWIIAAITSLLAVALTLTALFTFRFELWRSQPKLRWVLRLLIIADPNLRTTTKAEVRKLLGPPQTMEGRYCWFPRELRRMTGDLRFELGASNQISSVHFLWRDWKPTQERPIDFETWKNQTETERWAMNADLVRRWPSGDFRGKLGDVADVLRNFPGSVFIDHWQFASDGGYGLGGSLDFVFDPDGNIQKVRFGYID